MIVNGGNAIHPALFIKLGIKYPSPKTTHKRSIIVVETKAEQKKISLIYKMLDA